MGLWNLFPKKGSKDPLANTETSLSKRTSGVLKSELEKPSTRKRKGSEGPTGGVQAPPENKASRDSRSQKSPRELTRLTESFSELSIQDQKDAEVIDYWRSWDTLQHLAEFCGLSNACGKTVLDSFCEISNIGYENRISVQIYIIDEAQKYYKAVKDDLQDSEYGGLRWVADYTSAHEENRIVSMFLRFVQITLHYDINRRKEYFEVCKLFLPAASLAEITAYAFHRAPENERDVSQSILGQINEYFEAYTSKSFLAPYTSLVGPSGIGKSYAIQHMARKGVYVIYASFADRDSTTYPRRSLLADEITRFYDRDLLTNYFECYVAAGMANFRVCRSLGITAIGFFDIQVKAEFSSYRKRLNECVNWLYRASQNRLRTAAGHPRNRSDDNADGFFSYQDHINQFLRNYKEAASEVFFTFSRSFAGRREYVVHGHHTSTLPKDQLQAIICFDEARALLDPERRRGSIYEMKFLALRRALRHQTKTGKDTDDKRFFALFLGTTGRVSDFSPPTHDDSSLKSVDPETLDLFAPLYKIDTFDLFAIDERKGWTQLFSSLHPDFPGSSLDYWNYLGRPAWGALRPKYTLEDVQKIAVTKIFQGRSMQGTTTITEVEALALLSYRINFDIKSPSLAEKLTAGYMLYIHGIGARRVLLETAQVSEPMLAFSSQQEMSRDSGSRLQIVKQLYCSATNGTVNAGDIGEMVAALVLLFTFDRALQGTFRPMKLSKFLDVLLPGKIKEQFVGCMGEQNGLKYLWKHGHVFFNHFGRMEDEPCEEILRTAFYRGAALFTKRGHKGSDIMVPVLLPTNDKKMSYIVIQVKNREKDVLGDGLRHAARNELRESLGDLPKPRTAHIGIMLALRGKKGREDAGIAYPLERGERLDRKLRDHPETPPPSKYSFNDLNRVVAAIVGMDFDLYPGFVHPNDSRETPGASSEVLYILKALLALEDRSHEDKEDYHQRLSVFKR